MSEHQGDQLLGEFETWLRTERHLRPATARAYVATVARYLDATSDPAHATRANVLALLTVERRRGLSAGALRTSLAAVQALHRYLVRAGVRDTDPAATITVVDRRDHAPDTDEAYAPDVLEALREDYPTGLDYDTGRDPVTGRPTAWGLRAWRRGLVAVDLLARQALTAAELAAVLARDVDLDAGTVFVRGSPPASGRASPGRPRRLPLGARQAVNLRHFLAEDLPEWLARAGVDPAPTASTPLIFGVRTGAPLGPGAVRHLLNRGRPREHWLSPRVIRRTVIADLLDAGHDVRLVQAFAGHTSATTTERYRRRDRDDLARAVERWHPRR